MSTDDRRLPPPPDDHSVWCVPSDWERGRGDLALVSLSCESDIKVALHHAEVFGSRFAREWRELEPDFSVHSHNVRTMLVRWSRLMAQESKRQQIYEFHADPDGNRTVQYRDGKPILLVPLPRVWPKDLADG